jgi:hypothetical protein
MKRIIFTIILTLVFTALPIHAVSETAFTGAGVIESTTGGFKFPDGSVQTTAAETADPECIAITDVPVSIVSAGMYCFTGILATAVTNGNAIQVNSDDVVIDMKGWILDGSAAGAGTLARGIKANERNNVVIKNGTIRGFFTGIELDSNFPFTGVQGYLVENIRAIANTYRGFLINGTDTVVRDSVVLDTGGSSSYVYAEGMKLQGPGLRLLNNDIGGLVATDSGNANAVYLNYGDGAVIEGNRVYDLTTDTGNAFGIYTSSSDDVLIKNNSVARMMHGIRINTGSALVIENRMMNMDTGLWYNSSTGKYRDNLTFDVTTPFTNGTDAGGND